MTPERRRGPSNRRGSHHRQGWVQIALYLPPELMAEIDKDLADMILRRAGEYDSERLPGRGTVARNILIAHYIRRGRLER